MVGWIWRKRLLPAFLALLLLYRLPSNAIQSMSQTWFRSKMRQVKSRLAWMKSPKPIPLSEIAKVESLKDFANRLKLSDFRGPRTTEDIVEVFDGLKDCFRNFSPPPGLALDLTADSSISPDDAVKQLFTFIPPAHFIHQSIQSEPPAPSQSSSVDTTETDFVTIDISDAQEAEDTTIQPLRLVKFSSDPKHILASIIRDVYTHFRGPSCRQISARLDGFRRIFLRNNSKAAVMEPLLMFALLQGNAASAEKFSAPSSKLVTDDSRGSVADQLDRLKASANTSSDPGVYDVSLIVTYFDLVKAGDSGQLRKIEKALESPADESVIGNKLFGNSLASPTLHANITKVGRTVGDDEELLQKVVERIGHMAMDSSEAASILLPNYPNVSAFVRGVSFFAFEGVFKQNGPYVMPGLPCGGNLSGSMLETITKRKLGTSYYVYKYTRPLVDTNLPNDVWIPEDESEVAQYLKQTQHAEQGEYLFSHVPRVCVRSKLFQKCAEKPPRKVEGAKEQLCEFINTHRAFFFRVDGRGVYAMRKNMQKILPRGGLWSRSRRALGRTLRLIRRFVFSKAFLAPLVGMSVRALCVAAGLSGVLGGALCAIGAMGSATLFRTLFAVAPFTAQPPIPLSLGFFLAADFARNMNLTLKILGLPNGNPDSEHEMGQGDQTVLSFDSQAS